MAISEKCEAKEDGMGGTRSLSQRFPSYLTNTLKNSTGEAGVSGCQL